MLWGHLPFTPIIARQILTLAFSIYDKYGPTDDDEISLFEIYEILRDSWHTIALLAVVGAALAAVLAFVLPQKYETQVYLQAPLPAQYLQANETRTPISGLAWVTGEDLYGYFLTQLTSEAAKHEFFEKTYLPSLKDAPQDAQQKNALYATVMKQQVLVKEPVPKKGRQLYSVQVQAPSGEQAARWTQDFLDQVETAARQQWIQNEERTIATVVKSAQKDLAEKLALAERLRADREDRLTEALKVAKAVGQQSPQMTMGQLPKQDSTAALVDGSSLYARGVKSLAAEIEVLRTRKDEMAFLDGVREIQAKLKALGEQKFAENTVGMYRIDGPLQEPAKPVSPKKSLMVAIGLLLGLLGGVVFAFVRHALAARKAGLAQT